MRIENQKPVHTSWEKFCETELNISGNHARTLMTVAKEFTREQVEEIGVEKLRLVARADKSKRPKMLEVARGLSKRDFADKVKKEISGRSRSNNAHSETQRKATNEATARRQQAASGDKVSIVFETGEVELPLRDAGAGKRWIGSEDHVNGVRSMYEVVIKGKKAILKISRARQ
jgi:hypothetical protein